MGRPKNSKLFGPMDEIAGRLNISDARRKKRAHRVIQDCVIFVRDSFPYERKQEELGRPSQRIRKLRKLEKTLEEFVECLEENWELTMDTVPWQLISIIKPPPKTLSSAHRFGYQIRNQRRGKAYLKSATKSLLVFREALSGVLAQQNSPRSGRPSSRNAVVSFIQGCAEAFEWLTGTKATRRVRGKDHSQRGATYGPFYDFLVSIWEMAGRDTAEIANGLRDWRRLEKQGKVSKGYFDPEYFSQKNK